MWQLVRRLALPHLCRCRVQLRQTARAGLLALSGLAAAQPHLHVLVGALVSQLLPLPLLQRVRLACTSLPQMQLLQQPQQRQRGGG